MIPNALSFARLVLTPVFLWLHLHGRAEAALVVFVVAASTDALDGLLARLLDQRSKLGAFLDPLADKVLGFAALSALVLERALPRWLLVLVLLRDGLMVFGALVVRHKRLELPSAPSRTGKYATFALTCLVVLVLVEQSSYASPALRGYTAAVGWIVALCIVISTLQYFTRFGYLFFAPGRSEPSTRRSQISHP